jgi:hypothetical protein
VVIWLISLALKTKTTAFRNHKVDDTYNLKTNCNKQKFVAMALQWTAFVDFYFFFPLVAVVTFLYLLYQFHRRKTWRSLMATLACFVFACTIFWMWLVARHDYLITGQNYNRVHKFVCDPSVHIENEVG